MDGATLVYDDDCGFCTWWARFVAKRSDVTLVGFSALEDGGDELGADEGRSGSDLAAIRERLPDDYEDCSHLVTDEEVYSCGASMEEAIVRSEICRGLDLSGPVGFLRHFRDYNRARERAYRWVADHRGLLGHAFSAETPASEDGGPADEPEDD